MGNEDLIAYFIKNTDERLDEIDKKLDELLSFKWQIVGGSVVVSVLINLGLAFIMK